jgi:hypothetical protein
MEELMALLWLLPVLVVVFFLQNMVFTWTSRSRNSGDPEYHRYAAWCSNGIWFVTQGFVFKLIWEPLMNGQWWVVIVGGLAYIVSTTEGSVFMMRLLLGQVKTPWIWLDNFLNKYFVEKQHRKVGSDGKK